MLIRIEIIAIISAINCINVYFYEKNSKFIMPVTFRNWYKFSDTLFEKFNSLTTQGIKVLNIKIIKNRCYLTFLTKNKVKSLEINYQVGILVAQRYELPVFTNLETLNKEGIKITKQMIEHALSVNY